MARRHTAFAALALGSLAACSSDQPTAPASAGAPSFTAAEGAEAPRHLFVFAAKSVPADFADRVAAAGGTIEKAFGPLGIASVRGLSAESAASLGAATDVAHWNADVEMVLDRPDGEPVVESAEGLATVEPASATNPTTASFYPRQWHLRQIGADKAWAAGKLGSPSVKVGILDTGLDYKHPDLAGRVDLALSKSFVPADDARVQQLFPGEHPIADLHYHGTHVGATVSSNAVLAAGVTSQVTLVGIKVLGADGRGDSFKTLDAIVYAADIGLDVVNMSLGIAAPLTRREYA